MAPTRRTESQATMRFRSDSTLTSSTVDREETVEHPVESRSITAELPPVMVWSPWNLQLTTNVLLILAFIVKND